MLCLHTGNQKVGRCRCRDGSLSHQCRQRTRSSPDLSADRCWRCRTRRHGARSHQSLPAGQPTASAAVICRPWLLQCCHQATVPSVARSVDPPRCVALYVSFRRLLYNSHIHCTECLCWSSPPAFSHGTVTTSLLCIKLSRHSWVT